MNANTMVTREIITHEHSFSCLWEFLYFLGGKHYSEASIAKMASSRCQNNISGNFLLFRLSQLRSITLNWSEQEKVEPAGKVQMNNPVHKVKTKSLEWATGERLVLLALFDQFVLLNILKRSDFVLCRKKVTTAKFLSKGLTTSTFVKSWRTEVWCFIVNVN